MERWQLASYPRLRAQRAVVVINRLATLVPPRVCAAVLRIWLAGWCSARRFGSTGSCVCCSLAGSDSVAHASVCRALADFGSQHLGLARHGIPDDRRLHFLLLESASQLCDSKLILGAIRVSAAYRVHCRLRRKGQDRGNREMVMRALAQAAKESVLGHAAAFLYDARFTY